MTLGQRIQELRKKENLSQDGLGELLGVSRQAISKWESDLTIPELDKLIALSKLFALPVDQLLGLERPAPPPGGETGSKALRRWLAGLTALCLLLTGAMGLLWGRYRQLEKALLLQNVELVSSGKRLFETMDCTLNDISLDFRQGGGGSEDLELQMELRPVAELKGWTVEWLDAAITGHDPWGSPGTERDWTETRRVEVTRSGGRYRAALTIPGYRGETVTLSATLRENSTGLYTTVEEVFVVQCQFEKITYQVTELSASVGRMWAVLPKTLDLTLPDRPSPWSEVLWVSRAEQGRVESGDRR